METYKTVKKKPTQRKCEFFYIDGDKKECDFCDTDKICAIPNSSKISDIYFPDKDLWIEIDGINREKRKEWLGKDYEYWLEKLKIYEEQKLNYKIIYTAKEIALIV